MPITRMVTRSVPVHDLTATVGMAVAPGGGVSAGEPVPAGRGVDWPGPATGVDSVAPVIFQPATKSRTEAKTR